MFLTIGLTWLIGIILDLNGFNIGLMLGKDWIINKKTWVSLGINLTSKNKDL